MRFKANQLIRFLQAVDRHLGEQLDFVIIGGTAALLAYGAQRTTRDIDTDKPYSGDLRAAVIAATRETGFDIPVEYPGVEDPPYDYVQRLQLVNIPNLQKLTVKVPEKHDLVLMKAVRGQENDLQVAEEIHKNHPLDLDVLIERWRTEMQRAIGDRSRLDGNFIVLISRLFGEDSAEMATERLKAGTRNGPKKSK